MLGLLGIFGALFAGFMADGLMSGAKAQNTDDTPLTETEDDALQPAAATESTSDLLEFIDRDTETDSVATETDSGAAESDATPQDAVDPTPTADPDRDTVLGPDENTDSTDTPPLASENIQIQGWNDDDILTGDAGADTVDGGGGNDVLGGRAGDDLISGGYGDDNIDGSAGNDSLSGDDGDDVVQGNDGHDQIAGGAGNDSLTGHMDDDTLLGDDGDDSLIGGAGNDSLLGGVGEDWVAGGYDDDVLQGGAGHDTLDGNAGNDTLWGFDPDTPSDSQGSDFLNGGDGDDTLMIGAGDYAHGGMGADIFTLGDWIGDGSMAHITDYDPAEDDIVILYDATAHPDPHVELITDDGSSDATVWLDGIPLAVITNGAGLTVDQLTLMPSSSF